MVVAYELPGVVSVRERGMGVQGGLCRGNDRVFFVSGFQDLRGNARGGGASASGWTHKGTTWWTKNMFHCSMLSNSVLFMFCAFLQFEQMGRRVIFIGPRSPGPIYVSGLSLTE